MNRKIRLYTPLLLLAFTTAGCGPTGYLIRPVPVKEKLKETLIQRDRGAFVNQKIAVIDVDGIMVNRQKLGFLRAGENPVSLFVEKLNKAASDQNVKAVVLRLNSPGGTVAASDIMYHKLLQFKRQTGKPVVACMLTIATSGAYYLACGCDAIVAQPGCVTGGIGTIVQTISFAGTMKKLGIKSVTIKSGELKDMASPLHDLSEPERKVLQEIITQFYQQFLQVVANGRQNLKEQKLRLLADGRIFTAKQALQEGLIDRVGYPQQAVAWAKEMAAIKKARLVIYHRPLGYKPNIYGSETIAASTMTPLINIQLPDWLTSTGVQFLYLWQPGKQ